MVAKQEDRISLSEWRLAEAVSDVAFRIIRYHLGLTTSFRRI